MIKNQAGQSTSIALVNTNGVAVTTGTTVVYLTKDGGTQQLGQGTVEHEGHGQWKYKPTQEETNADEIAFLFVNSLAIPISQQVYTVPPESYAAAEAAATAAQYDLITLAEMQTFPGFTSLTSTEEDIIESLIHAATFDFEKEWGTFGVQRAVADEQHRYQQIMRDTADGNKIQLDKIPVVLASGITIVDPAGNEIASTEFWVDPDWGQLNTVGGFGIPVDDNGFTAYWKISYVAGWVPSTAYVPANIKTACKRWVASLFKRVDRDLISKKIGDLTLTYAKAVSGSGESLPDDIKNMISQWKISRGY